MTVYSVKNVLRSMSVGGTSWNPGVFRSASIRVFGGVLSTVTRCHSRLLEIGRVQNARRLDRALDVAGEVDTVRRDLVVAVRVQRGHAIGGERLGVPNDVPQVERVVRLVLVLVENRRGAADRPDQERELRNAVVGGAEALIVDPGPGDERDGPGRPSARSRPGLPM